MKAPRRKSSLYTRSGDTGETATLTSGRVSKAHPRVEAVGDIDELNSTLGLAAASLRQRKLVSLLQDIQNELLNIGAELAAVGQTSGPRPSLRLQAARVEAIEKLIDEYDAKSPRLSTFILPGGHAAAAQLHVARTVCRRAERAISRLAETAEVNPQVTAYLNRLSDLLFALARYVNRAERRKETLWRKG